MNCANCERCPMALALRWAGRGLGLAMFAFVAWFLVAHLVAGEGPNPLKMRPVELALFVTLFAAVAGISSDISVLFIEHDMDVVFRFASRIIVMVSGRILVEGTPEEISSNAQVREVYLGSGHG